MAYRDEWEESLNNPTQIPPGALGGDVVPVASPQMTPDINTLGDRGMGMMEKIGTFIRGYGEGSQGRGEQFLQNLSKERKTAWAEDIRSTINDLENGNEAGAMARLTNRKRQIAKLGGDSATTDFVVNLIDTGNTDGALKFLNTLDYQFSEGGFIPARATPEIVPGSAFSDNVIGQRDPITGEITYSSRTNPDGSRPSSAATKASAMTRMFDNGTTQMTLPNGESRVLKPDGTLVTGRAERVRVLEAARQEQVDMKLATSRAGTRGTAEMDRIQSDITRGITAGESLATMYRAVDLLNLVETGGVDKAGLAIKSAFGVESADEGELASLLGKAVLSQLRETFGAAFTENEGKRLEAIEAGMGSSPATNRRLLGNAIQIALRVAERGESQAKELGADSDSVWIRGLIDYRLDPDFGVGDPVIEVDL